MKVSTDLPYQIVYSLFEHQYLGYLFESFVVQLDSNNKLTLQYQNISHLNANEFSEKLDEKDYELIELMDAIQQDAIIKKFGKRFKKISTEKFFLTIYDKEKGDKALQQLIHEYIEERRAKIMNLLVGKLVFEMGNDGVPHAKTIRVQAEKATVRFHFHRNPDNTHYYPTIKHEGQVLDFRQKGGMVICHHPAWLLLKKDSTSFDLYSFEGNVDGKKLQPFLRKKFINIPKKIEASYYSKFVAPLLEEYDILARGQGLYIETEKFDCEPVLEFAEMQSSSENLFSKSSENNTNEQISFHLNYQYGPYKVSGGKNDKRFLVELKEEEDSFTFYKIGRDENYEKRVLDLLSQKGLDLTRGTTYIGKNEAFSWLSEYAHEMENLGVAVKQVANSDKKYFVGQATISVEIKENKDWFDIHAIVKFGAFEIPFIQLRKLILNNTKEFVLPNGEIAVIPDSWFAKYGDLLHFMDAQEDVLMLKKHHLAVVHDLQDSNLASVSFNRKLEKLRDFEKIEDFAMPEGFKGELRPYQKAGYNWMNFLASYNFGGCLADDMGLGKTVQTLAMLQAQKESSGGLTNLLIMPTSLLYNWEMEAKKFTPELKVLNYTGSNRNKNPQIFDWYDLVITSYGIARIDSHILQEYFFNYIILDESQVIKNPNSNIAKAVKELKSRRKLILTGTPIENNTLDLWSQMTFANPGLLGTQNFFKKEYQTPIERKNDEEKYQKLHAIIKPFILRRHKSQVATELPGKIEKVQYCEMSDAQKKRYDEVKSSYRNEILEQIETQGLKGSQFMLLKGLTELRQLANHPKMVDETYDQTSGKMEEVLRALDNALGKEHKILIFSQFVKHLHILKGHLDENKVDYAYLDGSTKDRQQEVNKFQNNKKCQVFLISLKAGGLGLNLTAADYVFILDPWWNPAIEAQAVDRAHRIGQENQVFIYKFITKGSVEEKILALQKNKLDLANNLISTEESFMKKLTKEDIEALLN
ncbi:DEAD/DEAH box helicase [Sediminitomix flava]|uniref:Helicase-like protein n=1 Tax=Sediminitomix flava TaxID=379075 RepID=A0A315Z5E9_SEDFL|nr:SNF2-related protein [Sediminitomix flava]PWJ39123.1 helicase-like protein [Sediminitomix flava]